MKKPRASMVQGFEYDGETKRAHFEYIKPGTKGVTRKRKTVTASSRAIALKLWSAFMDECKAAYEAEPAPAPITLAGYVSGLWQKTMSRIAPSTRRGYRNHIKNVLLPELGHLPLGKITTAELSDLAGRMKNGETKKSTGETRGKKYAPQTIRHCLSLVARILRDAIDRDVIEVYPLKGKVLIDPPKRVQAEFSEEELRRFLAAFEDEPAFCKRLAERQKLGPVKKSPHFPGRERRFGAGRRGDSEAARFHFQRFQSWKPVFVVMLETGLRKGDVKSLVWSEVDDKEQLVKKVTSKRKVTVEIPISGWLRWALDELAKRHKSIGPESRVAVTEDGNPIGDTMLYRYFVTAKELAGITRRFRIHDCRHSLGSSLVSHGAPLEVVQKILGHEDITSTQRYARASRTATRKAIKALEREGKP